MTATVCAPRTGGLTGPGGERAARRAPAPPRGGEGEGG